MNGVGEVLAGDTGREYAGVGVDELAQNCVVVWRVEGESGGLKHWQCRRRTYDATGKVEAWRFNAAKPRIDGSPTINFRVIKRRGQTSPQLQQVGFIV